MKNPFEYAPDQPVIIMGRVFGTPLARQGWNWLPLNQILMWALFTWQSLRARPAWPAWRHALLGGLQMTVMLGSEWCHNLAHAAAAKAVGKPADSLRIIMGMPVLIYHEPEHPSVTPRQHIIRALGGPLCSLTLLLLSKAFQRITPPASAARQVANAAVGMNTFIALGSFTPIPAFDGGPILKWSLVARGASPTHAGQIVTRASRAAGMALLAASALAIHRRRWLPAAIMGLLGALSLLFGKAQS